MRQEILELLGELCSGNISKNDCCDKIMARCLVVENSNAIPIGTSVWYKGDKFKIVNNTEFFNGDRAYRLDYGAGLFIRKEFDKIEL